MIEVRKFSDKDYGVFRPEWTNLVDNALKWFLEEPDITITSLDELSKRVSKAIESILTTVDHNAYQRGYRAGEKTRDNCRNCGKPKSYHTMYDSHDKPPFCGSGHFSDTRYQPITPAAEPEDHSRPSPT